MEQQDPRQGRSTAWRPGRWLPAAAVLLTGCAPQPATEQGRAIYWVYNFFMVAAAVVFVVVGGLIVWSVVRYRDDGSEGEPSQVHGNRTIEAVWTLVPLLIVIVLVVASFRAQNRVNYQSPRPAVIVRVIAFQWQWRFEYPDSGVEVVGTKSRPAVLVLPVGQPVHVRLTSADVQHGFYIPRLLYKRDAIPGRINDFDMTITAAGTYQGVCGFICGLAHSDMGFLVHAVPPDEFQRWLATNGAPG
jgi:cytochrome c oxidase subunit II